MKIILAAIISLVISAVAGKLLIPVLVQLKAGHQGDRPYLAHE